MATDPPPRGREAWARRGFRPGDEARLIELYELSFHRRRSRREFAWRYQQGPAHTEFLITTLDDDVAASVSFQAFAAWVMGELTTAVRGGDLAVDPRYRGRGATRAGTTDGLKILGRHAVAVHFPAEVTYRVYEAPIVERSGRLPQWIRWQTAAAIGRDEPRAPRWAAVGGAAALRMAGRIGPRVGRRVVCREVRTAEFPTVSARLDRLGAASHTFAPCIVRRDAEYVHWRWLARPDPWRLIVAGSGEELGGYIAFRTLADDCRIGDLLAPDAATMRALLHAAAEATAPERPGRTLLELSDPRPWSQRVLRQAGFSSRGTGPAVSLLAMREGVSPAVERLSSWYLTAGDTDLV